MFNALLSLEWWYDPEMNSQEPLKLGDELRSERARIGKSLMDVQRELRIGASYIAAIENADLSVFDNLSFVAGYVRSYARYLGMDPERVFSVFCSETGFSGAANLPISLGDATATFSRAGTKSSPVISSKNIPVNLKQGENKSAVVMKKMAFAAFYPAFLVLDVLNYIVSSILGRETHSDLEFQSVSYRTTDWWSVISITISGIFGILFYASTFVPAVENVPSRVLLSLSLAIVFAFVFLWFNPRFFFARITLALLAPILLASIFGVEVKLEANGALLGGYVDVGAKQDPIQTLVLGFLCALAMLLHKRS